MGTVHPNDRLIVQTRLNQPILDMQIEARRYAQGEEVNLIEAAIASMEEAKRRILARLEAQWQAESEEGHAGS